MILFYLCLLLSLLLVKAKTDTKQEARLMKKLIASIVSKCQAWPAIFLFFTFINFWLVFLVAFFSKLIFYCSNFGIDIPCPFLSRKTSQIIGRSNFVWKPFLPPLTHPIFNETIHMLWLENRIIKIISDLKNWLNQGLFTPVWNWWSRGQLHQVY